MSLKAILSTFPILLHCTRDVFNFIGLEMIESDSINIFSLQIAPAGLHKRFQ